MNSKIRNLSKPVDLQIDRCTTWSSSIIPHCRFCIWILWATLTSALQFLATIIQTSSSLSCRMRLTMSSAAICASQTIWNLWLLIANRLQHRWLVTKSKQPMPKVVSRAREKMLKSLIQTMMRLKGIIASCSKLLSSVLSNRRSYSCRCAHSSKLSSTFVQTLPLFKDFTTLASTQSTGS